MARVKEKKFHFIYKTTCLITDSYYYGMHSTDNLDDDYLGSGKRLRYSIRKYGNKNHQIEKLEFFESRGDLAKREEEVVNENEIAKKECMNMILGGEAFSSGAVHLEISSKGGKATSKRIKNDPELKRKLGKLGSEKLKRYRKSGLANYNTFGGKTHSDETKQKMRDSHKLNNHQSGKNNSQFETRWINNDSIERKISKMEEIPAGWKLGRIKSI